MSFEQLPLISPLLKALKEEGYETPTPIQVEAIPVVLKQKDLLACAQTGTGKTAAFSLPILQLLDQVQPKKRGIRTLILTPTRELAIQIGESLSAYGNYLSIKHTVIFGGVSQLNQTKALKSGMDILVATPGRLLDLMQQGFVKLDHIEIFVLDEADRMLDMGFIHDVKKIIGKLPTKKQTLLFSATMPPEIQQLAKTLLHQPSIVAVTPPSSTVEKISQYLYYTNKSDKVKLLDHLLDEEDIGQALVFSRTKHGADRVVRILDKKGHKAKAIHGNKSQNARQNALKDFKDGKIKVLVATDIAARGIDIDELEMVINFDLPEIPETYVHRIGRTGRAGLSGKAISFCDGEQHKLLKDIEKLIGLRIEVVHEHPYPFEAQKSEESPSREKKKQPTRNKRYR
ncbi:DEAD/DEAH box helicase [Pleomorphovibrio marinus]|uniref:DEAD/DEAH box helicase n=1 Tax=Pleomorphovibrio marinus TaxID=2164132 RepID=UPI000E09E906|nr:DEAD/DEAH box helicase [Pleomorphovibrio marinus]